MRFRHQLLQEYFTARAMRKRLTDDSLDVAALWPSATWWQRSGWEESAVQLAGLYPADCTLVIDWLRDGQPEVAAQCLLESGSEVADRAGLRHVLRASWLPRLTDLTTDPEPEARAAVGRALGRLGLDDRLGVGLTKGGLPDIDWVPISGGEFIYQMGELRRIEPFWISRYPITNSQWQAFRAARNGYCSGRWWRRLTHPDRTPAEPRWDLPNHPRETVSWYEAMAFCAWLGDSLKLAVTLPTEWQWERAARGTSGRPRPWMSRYQPGYANIQETWAGPHSLLRTSPVGIYPQGRSEDDGVADLSGNVLEWCLNEHEKPHRVQPGGTRLRVARGGSWNDGPSFARATFRLFFDPHLRSDDLGFRVVCMPPNR